MSDASYYSDDDNGPGLTPVEQSNQSAALPGASTRASAVNKLMAGAIEGAANNPRLVNAADLALRRTVDAEVAANLSGDYLDAALMENLEIALGRRKVATIRVVGRGEMAKSIEVQVFDRDAGAANKAAELLYRRIEIRGRAVPPGQRKAELPPAIREAIDKAGRIARGEE